VTSTPTKWSLRYFEYLFKYEWKAVKGPAGLGSGRPRTRKRRHRAGRARPEKKQRPDDVHTDIALKTDQLREDFEVVPREPEKFDAAFARRGTS